MSGTYEMTFEVPMDMLQRAMTSWGQPHRSRIQKLTRLGIVILFGAILGILIGVFGLLDMLSDVFVIGALVGFYIGLIFWWLVHKRGVKRIAGFVAVHLEKQGKTHAKFSAKDVELETNLGSSRSSWAAFDQVVLMADATALRSGAVIYPIPHAALPAGVDAVTFHDDLVRWQEAGQ